MLVAQEVLEFMQSLWALRPDIAWTAIFISYRREYKQKRLRHHKHDSDETGSHTRSHTGSHNVRFDVCVLKGASRHANEVQSISVIYTAIKLLAETMVSNRGIFTMTK